MKKFNNSPNLKVQIFVKIICIKIMLKTMLRTNRLEFKTLLLLKSNNHQINNSYKKVLQENK